MVKGKETQGSNLPSNGSGNTNIHTWVYVCVFMCRERKKKGGGKRTEWKRINEK